MTITCPENSTVCTMMDDAGAGLGVFIQYLATALPVLLIILAVVGVIVAVGVGIGKLLQGSISKHR
jgi:hypothetical protein